MSKYYGKTNAIVSNGGSGGELNLAYGLTPPTDTTKIWVQCEEPEKIKVMGNRELTVTNNGVYVITNKATIPTTQNLIYSKGIKIGDDYYFIGSGTILAISSGYGYGNYVLYSNEVATSKSLGSTTMKPYSIIKEDEEHFTVCFEWNGVIYWKTYAIAGGFTEITTSNYTAFFNCCKGEGYYWSVVPTNSGFRIYKKSAATSGASDFVDISYSGSRISIYSNYYEQTRACCYYNGAIYFICESGTTAWSDAGDIKLYKWIIGNLSITELKTLATNVKFAAVCNMEIFDDVITISQLRPYDTNEPINKLFIYNISKDVLDEINITNYQGITTIDQETGDIELWGGAGMAAYPTLERKIDVNYELEENNLELFCDPTSSKNIKLINTSSVVFDIPINHAWLGDVNDKAEPVRMFKYENNHWIGINTFDIGMCWQEVASDTQLSASIYCNVGDLVIASIIARDGGSEIVSSDWTLISRSQVGQLNQTLAFYKKIATSTKESITVKQSTAGRIYIDMYAFEGKTTTTFGEWVINDNAIGGEITLPNKLCIVSASNNLWTTSSPYSLWTYSPQSSGVIVIGNYDTTQSRLTSWIDSDGGTRTITSGITDANGNTNIIGYVIIE